MSPLFRAGWLLEPSLTFFNWAPCRQLLTERANFPETQKEGMKLTLCEQDRSPKSGGCYTQAEVLWEADPNRIPIHGLNLTPAWVMISLS